MTTCCDNTLGALLDGLTLTAPHALQNSQPISSDISEVRSNWSLEKKSFLFPSFLSYPILFYFYFYSYFYSPSSILPFFSHEKRVPQRHGFCNSFPLPPQVLKLAIRPSLLGMLCISEIQVRDWETKTRPRCFAVEWRCKATGLRSVKKCRFSTPKVLTVAGHDAVMMKWWWCDVLQPRLSTNNAETTCVFVLHWHSHVLSLRMIGNSSDQWQVSK